MCVTRLALSTSYLFIRSRGDTSRWRKARGPFLAEWMTSIWVEHSLWWRCCCCCWWWWELWRNVAGCHIGQIMVLTWHNQWERLDNAFSDGLMVGGRMWCVATIHWYLVKGCSLWWGGQRQAAIIASCQPSVAKETRISVCVCLFISTKRLCQIVCYRAICSNGSHLGDIQYRSCVTDNIKLMYTYSHSHYTRALRTHIHSVQVNRATEVEPCIFRNTDICIHSRKAVRRQISAQTATSIYSLRIMLDL